MASAVSRSLAPLRGNKVIIPDKWEPKARASADQQWPSLSQCAIVSVALKILLFPSYRSTDFEVHRNWLAITNSLPIKAWYYEKTSEWTLDYPPAFAVFEWLMSWPASIIDNDIVQIKNLSYDAWSVISFQRSTVIITELLLVYALHVYSSTASPSSKKQAHAVALSILSSPGLLIIDHIHFQYNGFLYGWLILSISLARTQSGMLLSGILFAVLLCLKHIYLYLAPAYFVYLLRMYCLDPNNVFRPRISNILKLGISMIAVFGTILGPFIYCGQLEQLKARLFPFSRGLCHAYWAPNIWALYSFTDRLLIYLAPYLNLSIDTSAINSVTRGLVGDTSFAVLPNITPQHCFALTVTLQLIALTKLWSKPTWNNFVGAITLCGFASFLVGWHVHEKAILLVIIPFSLVALRDRSYLASFRPLAVAGHVSLFPLIFTVPEFPIKIVYTLTWLMAFMYTFSRLAPAPATPRRFLLDRFTLLYTAVAIPLVAYCNLVHGYIFGERYEFVPLMFVSTWSAVGVVASWLGFSVCYLMA